MQAKLVAELPGAAGWLYELKLDGYRALAVKDGDRVRLLSRRNNDLTAEYPQLRAAIARLQAARVVLDGEIVALDEEGRPSFEALQHRAREGTVVVYFAFDVLHLEGQDTFAMPLQDRKALLPGIVGESGVQISETLEADGRAVVNAVRSMGLEGVIAKRRQSRYEPGLRSGAWVKFKVERQQEFVIGGYRPGSLGVDALLIGYHVDGKLRFAAKVRAGLTPHVRRQLVGTLKPLHASDCPFVDLPSSRSSRWGGGVTAEQMREMQWVRPSLVAQVRFVEWTSDGHLRHAAFMGLRDDKPARSVVREVAMPPSRQEPSSSTKRAVNRVRRSAKHDAEIAGIAVTHPDRILYPEAHLTKVEMVRYYEAVAEWILPHLRGRPLTLKQCAPDVHQCRFLRHSGERSPSHVRVVKIREQKKIGDYMIVDDLPALVSLAQRNIVEFHTWNSTIDRVETPDRVVVDLDPGPDVEPRDVVAAAQLARRKLKALGLESWVKTTGGRGLHVVIPIQPVHDWSQCLEFVRALAERVAEEDPTRYTIKFGKQGRQRQILVDYLRNNRTNTIVSAYSLRARPEPTVSMPLAWEELTPRWKPERWTLAAVLKALTTRDDPWKDYPRAKQRLPKPE
jgi:bifunctional non-homologous end joining protein LigD